MLCCLAHVLMLTSQLLNEIMPMIYKRFTEKSAEEWRQIYKSLQLMEFLVKNGSERVIDDCRSHLSLLKMLRQFHYIDQNGKDQGINVRNRSKELTDLLSDVDKIRQERKKAKATRNKYTGVEGGAGLGSTMSSSSRYGGFGSESAGMGAGYGGATRGVYGDGGGFGGESHDDYEDPGRRGGAERFDEYDEYDDGGATAPPAARRRPEASSRNKPTPKKPEPPKPKEPEVDLFDFGDDEPALPAASNGAASSAVLQPPSAAPLAAPAAAPAPADDDDDFDDFQSATPASAPAPAAAPSAPKPNYSSFSIPASTATPSSTTQYAQPAPQSGAQKADFSNLFSTRSPATSTTGTPAANYSAFSPPAQQAKATPGGTGYQPTGPNYFTSVSAGPAASPAPSSGMMSPQQQKIGAQPAKKPAAGGGDAFASLLGGSGVGKKQVTKGPTIADMAKQKSQAGLYGANAAPATYAAPTQQQQQNKPSTGSSGMDDLLG